METREEKLEAIRQQARKIAAERAQAEAAARLKGNREGRQDQNGRLTWGWVALALFVVVCGLWLLLSKEPKANREKLDESLASSAQAMREYKNSAFAMAALKELASRGISVGGVGADSVQHLSDDIYALTFSISGETYRIRGKYICDDGLELMPANMVDPICYLWL